MGIKGTKWAVKSKQGAGMLAKAQMYEVIGYTLGALGFYETANKYLNKAILLRFKELKDYVEHC